jgi:acyl carrier protein
MCAAMTAKTEKTDVTEQQIRAVLQEVAGDDVAQAAASAPLALDSFTLIGLVEGLEVRFGLRVAPHEVGADQFGSIAALLAFVQQKAGAVS